MRKKANDRKMAKKMILEIIQAVDYDIYKSFIPKTAENPETIKERMNELLDIVYRYTYIYDNCDQT